MFAEAVRPWLLRGAALSYTNGPCRGHVYVAVSPICRNAEWQGGFAVAYAAQGRSIWLVSGYAASTSVPITRMRSRCHGCTMCCRRAPACTRTRTSTVHMPDRVTQRRTVASWGLPALLACRKAFFWNTLVCAMKVARRGS